MAGGFFFFLRGTDTTNLTEAKLKTEINASSILLYIMIRSNDIDYLVFTHFTTCHYTGTPFLWKQAEEIIANSSQNAMLSLLLLLTRPSGGGRLLPRAYGHQCFILYTECIYGI